MRIGVHLVSSDLPGGPSRSADVVPGREPVGLVRGLGEDVVGPLHLL